MAGATTTLRPAEAILRYKDVAIRAAKTECQSVTDITTNETWERVKIHGVPLERYIGKGSYGTGKL